MRPRIPIRKEALYFYRLLQIVMQDLQLVSLRVVANTSNLDFEPCLSARDCVS
jgi:hypothetical protein